MSAESTHVVQDQSEIAAFMGSPAAHGASGPVERIDTHAAMVFLVGDLAYKIKRAVKFPYMDFSTLARRRRFCEREVELNRRTAPRLYRGVVPIVRRPDGALGINQDGIAIEWAVVMRRFEQGGLFDHLASTHGLTAPMIRDAADAISDFHMSAEELSGVAAVGGGHAGMKWVVDDNQAEMGEHPDLFPTDELAHFADASRSQLTAYRALLDDRLAQGMVRRCHGDLHLRNICMIDDRPTIFDAIEFEDRLSCIDVIYDLAFLIMDLEHRHLHAYANLILNRYLQSFERVDGLTALPLFLSARAGVRAKVAASAVASQPDASARAHKRDEAMSYFGLARTLLVTTPARLLVIGGLSGTGKTTLAGRLAPLVGNVPGAVHLRSDVVRKGLANVDELSGLPPHAYSPTMSERVYGVLADKAARTLAAGHTVIVDAVFLKPEQRARIEDVARTIGVPFHGIWLEAPLTTLLDRVHKRQADASDATADVVRKQAALPTGDVSWSRIDANRPLGVLTTEVVERLGIATPSWAPKP